MSLEDLKLKLKQYLVKTGLKQTQERDMLLKAVWQLGNRVSTVEPTLNNRESCHFSVDEVYDLICSWRFIVSKSTVYRTLGTFCEGKIIRFAFKRTGKTVYELEREEWHDHIICLKCGRIVEFSDTETEILHKRLCERYGFREVDHLHCIRGLCMKCDNKFNNRA